MNFKFKRKKIELKQNKIIFFIPKIMANIELEISVVKEQFKKADKIKTYI